MHVLIVDDHAFVCVGLKATLLDEYKGIDVTTTDHGDTALTILARDTIDLVIVDLFMPGAGVALTLLRCCVKVIPTSQ